MTWVPGARPSRRLAASVMAILWSSRVSLGDVEHRRHPGGEGSQDVEEAGICGDDEYDGSF